MVVGERVGLVPFATPPRRLTAFDFCAVASLAAVFAVSMVGVVVEALGVLLGDRWLLNGSFSLWWLADRDGCSERGTENRRRKKKEMKLGFS